MSVGRIFVLNRGDCVHPTIFYFFLVGYCVRIRINRSLDLAKELKCQDCIRFIRVCL